MSEAPGPVPQIRSYQFFDERRPKRMWMPALEAVNERFAQLGRAALLQQLQPPIEIAPLFSIEVIKHSEFIDRLPTPSHLTLVTLKPLSGAILIAIEPDLVGILIEGRFGGSGRLPVTAVPNREFAPIELRTIRGVVERLLVQLAAAWRPIVGVLPEIIRHETKPAFAAIAASTDFVIVNNFEVTIAGGKGRLALVIPYQSLQPLHERLTAGSAERSVIRDDEWSQELRIGIGEAALPLTVEFAQIELTVGEFLGLRPGSVFEIARPTTVTAQAHGVPLFAGRWGRHGRKIALRVEERLPQAVAAPAAGAAIVKGSESDDAG